MNKDIDLITNRIAKIENDIDELYDKKDERKKRI